METWTIFVCDKGMVLAGVARPHPKEPLTMIVDRCHIVRLWGTTRGVGQLALSGPTADTKVDPEGDEVLLSRWYVMRQITCTEEASKAWTSFTS